MKQCLGVRILRPRYLEIEGLQSFKELQSIDFDRLGETGLFGIFGATGSGKSTILDALTLALYGNVQRASRGTQGIINMSLSEMRVSFIFDLVKGEERKTYRVERVYEKKENSENYIESKVTRLIELSAAGDVVIADRQKEVNAAVIDLIGLQFSDFTRSVVLPQNKFQEFLLAPKGEKTKMLERIFYLEEYGRELMGKVNMRLKRLDNKISGVEGALSVLGDISNTSLKDSEETLAATAGHKKKVDDELKASEREYNSAKNVWELSAELQETAERLEELNGHAAEMDAVRKSCKNAAAARDLSERINDIKATDLKLKRTSEELKALEAGIEELERQLKDGEGELEKSSRLRQGRIPILIEYKTKLEKALQTREELRKIEEILQKLRNEHIALRGKIDHQDESIAKQRSALEGVLTKSAEQKARTEALKVQPDYRDKIQKGAILEEELEQLKKMKIRQKSRLNDFSIIVDRQKQELKALEESGFGLYNDMKAAGESYKRHKEMKRWDRNDITKAEERYYGIKSAADALRLIHGNIEETEVKISDCEGQIGILVQRLEGLGEEREKALRELKSTRLLLEEKKQEQERNSAFLLAQGLRDNEPCPVCGAKVHPNPAVPSEGMDIVSEAESIKELAALTDRLESEYRALESEIIKLTEQHNSLKSRKEALTADKENKQKEQTELYSKLPEDYRGLSLSLFEDALNRLSGEKKEKLEAVEDWEKRLAELDTALKKSTEEYSRFQVESSGKRSQLEANKKHLEELDKTYAEAEEACSDKEDSYNELIEVMGISSIRDALQRIQNNDREAEGLYREMQDMENRIGEMRKEIEKAEEEKKLDTEKLSENTAEGRGFKYQKEEKEKEIRLLIGDKDISTEISGTEEEMASLAEREQKAQEYVNTVREKYEKAIKDKKVHERQKEIYEEKLGVDTERLNRELADKGFATVEAAEEAIIPRDKTVSMEMAVKEYEEAVSSIKAHKGVIEKKLAGRSITDELWQEISRRYEALVLEKENSIAAYESAKNRYETIKSNYENWLSLTKELQEHSRKKEHLELIKNLLKGNSFIEYISEERLRYIAKEASETLGTLTRHRYGLELDTEDGFVIRDDANGGMRRLVTTLSGGETFLTSLALALALSSQIQLKGQSPLEFFFLDEGFGTLDTDLLDTVMDALERLSTGERVIGLISHVPEMKSRVTRRLVVEAPVINGAGSRVYMEKA